MMGSHSPTASEILAEEQTLAAIALTVSKGSRLCENTARSDVSPESTSQNALYSIYFGSGIISVPRNRIAIAFSHSPMNVRSGQCAHCCRTESPMP